MHIQVYPYELFQGVEEMRTCKQFPAYESFRTRMKGDVDKNVYNKNKAEFDRRIALSDDNPEKWHNFIDYLKYYNGFMKFHDFY